MSKEQPFSEFAAKKTQDARRNNGGLWVVAGLAVAALAAAGWLWSVAEARRAELAAAHAKAEGTAAQLAASTQTAMAAMTDSEQAKARITALQKQVADLAKEKERVGQAAKGLEEEMRADLESKDVTISKLQGKLTVNILDRVMFDSGEALMKPDGEAVLRKIAGILEGHKELKIQVIGHTDNVPIRNRFASNWELSAGRALAAVHFLTEKAGVDPKRVGAVAYGEYRPIADNATPEGRARNRRIAVTLLPDELAQADAVAGAAPPVTATNAGPSAVVATVVSGTTSNPPPAVPAPPGTNAPAK